MKDRLAVIKTMSWFLFINLVFSLLINIIYINNTSLSSGIWPISFLFTAMVSNTSIFFLLFAIIFGTILAFLPYKKLLFSLMMVFIPLFHIIIFVDAIIYKTFKFHFNSLVLNLFLTEGASDSVKLGTGNLILFSIIIITILLAEYILLKKLYKRAEKHIGGYRQLKFVLAIIIAFILADKSMYAVADLFGETYILQLSRAFPLYQPLTVKRTFRKYFGYEAAKKTSVRINKSSLLNYPKEELDFSTIEDKPNIIMLVLDAWRFDMHNEEVTPNIYRFAQENIEFTNHFSGGNASRFGVFSLLYGIYGNNWHLVVQNQTSPVLLDYLMKLDYDFKITASARLTYPEFRRTAFSLLQDYIEDDFPGSGAEQKDLLQTNRVIDWMKSVENSDKPFFLFSWLDAPHGPYSYPNEFEIFTPSKKSANYITTSGKDYDLLRNSYKNAIAFNDHLIGRIINYLKTSPHYDNSIIIITADHGEEFNEHGFLGHTSAFTKYQSQVPLVIHIPEKYRKNNNLIKPVRHNYMTSHNDIIPFLMETLGCKSSADIYSNGLNIFKHSGHKGVFVSGWSDAALITEENSIVFSTQSWNSNKFEVRDASYRKIRNYGEVMKNNAEIMHDTLLEMGAFSQ